MTITNESSTVMSACCHDDSFLLPDERWCQVFIAVILFLLFQLFGYHFRGIDLPGLIGFLTTFMLLTLSVVPCLNSTTTINSRIGEQNQRLRRTLTKLAEANDRHHALRTCVGCYIVSCFPPNAIPDGVSITLSAGISTQCVIAASDWP